MPTLKSAAAPRSMILNVREPVSILSQGLNHYYSYAQKILEEKSRNVTFREDNVLGLNISMNYSCGVKTIQCK